MQPATPSSPLPLDYHAPPPPAAPTAKPLFWLIVAAIILLVLAVISNVDVFRTYRWLLSVIVTIYCTIITAQSLWSYYVWLSAGDRYTTLLRRYIVVAALRMRFRDFWGELLICGLLCVAFCLMVSAQWKLDAIQAIYRQANVQNTNLKAGK